MPREHRNRLKELRQQGVVLSQSDVAKLLGYDLTTVCRHESGDRPLSKEALEAYARLYKVGTLELIMEVPDKEGDSGLVETTG